MPMRPWPIVLVLLLPACQASPTGSPVRQVTLPELEKETAGLPFFSYTGHDDAFHYFKAGGRQYKVKRDEWELPPNLPAMPPEAGAELFVRVKDGKVTVPDPKELSKHFPQQ